MEISIHSIDVENRGSKGRTYQVSSPEFAIEPANGRLHIIANDRDLYLPALNPFGGNTPPRDTTRNARVAFFPEEIKRIVEVAIEAKLLRIEVSVR